MLLIMSYWTKSFVIWGKLRRALPTKSGHFAPAYIGGSNKLRVSLEFLYGLVTLHNQLCWSLPYSLRHVNFSPIQNFANFFIFHLLFFPFIIFARNLVKTLDIFNIQFWKSLQNSSIFFFIFVRFLWILIEVNCFL